MGKPGRKRKTTSPPKRRSRTPTSDPPGEDGPDEAAQFIAEAAASLARLARRHRLDHLSYILAMARLEAEEHVRLRSRRKLS